MNSRYFLCALCAITLGGALQGCAGAPAPTSSLPLPAPTVSEYAETEAAGFGVKGGTNITYGMTYLLRKEVGDSPSYMVEFENPVAGEKPLASGGKLEPSQTEIFVASPVLPCIENHRNYKVSLKLFSGGNLVAQHDDLVQFSIPANLVRQTKLKTCTAAQVGATR